MVSNLDLTFGNGGQVTTDFFGTPDTVGDVLLQSDGKIILIGTANIDNPTGRIGDYLALTRYNSDGTLDTTFSVDGKVTTDTYPYFTAKYFSYNPGENRQVVTNAMLQPDGKILVSGYVKNVREYGRRPEDGTIGFYDSSFLVRYNSDGTLDTSFSGGIVHGTHQTSIDAALQSDGNILALTTSYSGGLYRYTQTGQLDSSFKAAFLPQKTFSFQSDGKILIGYQSFSDSSLKIGRLNLDGSLDTTFGNSGFSTLANAPINFSSNAYASIEKIISQADGKALTVSYVYTYSGSYTDFDLVVSRYNSDGSLDTSFGSGGTVTTDISDTTGFDSLSNLEVAPDGKILAIGSKSREGGVNYALLRFNSNGSLDTNFASSGKVSISSAGRLAIQPNASIFVAGSPEGDFTVAKYLGNLLPTDITLSSSTVTENSASNILVGTLATLDPDPGDTHTYTLATGVGDIDNNAFVIEGNGLRAKQSFDFETKNSYSIRLRASDQYGAAFEKQFTIQIADVPETPIIPNDPNGFPPFQGLTLSGTGTRDTLIGTNGNDMLIGKGGKDSLTGGAGLDQFVFDIGARFRRRVMGIDTITDFTPTQDKIVLDTTTFTKLKSLSFAAVKNVAQAQQSKALITYVSKTGGLYYNENGKRDGFGGGGQFADLTNGLILTKTDFSIVS